MNIFDCFIYNNEAMILDLRLSYLNKYVKKFIIVESKYTHQGNLKKNFLDLNDFKKYKDKIDYNLIDKFPENLSNWGRENYQRNFLMNSIKDLNENDYIMISDLDEIPNLRNLNSIVKSKFTAFQQTNYSFKFNLKNITFPIWYGTKLCKKKYLKSPQWLRDQKVKKYSFLKFYKIKWNIIQNGGWHFSYIMNPNEISEKIKSFSHAEYNLDKYTNIKTIEDKLSKGLDLFNRNQSYQKVELDSSFPKSFFENKNKFVKWFL
tara:strand:- start:48 stop:833 length:786 start_codon:yes stop_codon:yes gene_type:complete